jgi:hypothetical protein
MLATTSLTRGIAIARSIYWTIQASAEDSVGRAAEASIMDVKSTSSHDVLVEHASICLSSSKNEFESLLATTKYKVLFGGVFYILSTVHSHCSTTLSATSTSASANCLSLKSPLSPIKAVIVSSQLSTLWRATKMLRVCSFVCVSSATNFLTEAGPPWPLAASCSHDVKRSSRGQKPKVHFSNK